LKASGDRYLEVTLDASEKQAKKHQLKIQTPALPEDGGCIQSCLQHTEYLGMRKKTPNKKLHESL